MILHIPLNYKPLGGAELNLRLLLGRLKDEGHEHGVVCRGSGDGIEDGVKVFSFKDLQPRSGPFLGKAPTLALANYYCFRKLREVVKNNKIELIHLWYTLPFGLPGIYFKKTLGVPCVISLPGCDIYDPTYAMPRPMRLVQRYMLNQAETVTAVSDFLRQRALEICKRDIQVGYLGIDRSKWLKREKIDLKEKYNCDQVVITVGRLAKRKNLDCLIRSIPSIPKRDDAKFILIGSGEEEAHLKGLAKKLGVSDRVVFLGEIPNADLPPYYNGADLFALPSLFEGFGLVFIEAMTCGLPVITTTAGAAPEVVGDGGVLIPPQDENALSDALIGLLEDKRRRAKLGWLAGKRSERFTIEKEAAYYNNLFEELLSR